MNDDGLEEVVWFQGFQGGNKLDALISTPNGYQFNVIEDWGDIEPSRFAEFQFAFGGNPISESVLLTAMPSGGKIYLCSYDSNLELTYSEENYSSYAYYFSLHRYGSAQSDTFLIFADEELFIWQPYQLKHLVDFPIRDTLYSFNPNLLNTCLVDLDASGYQDLVIFGENEDVTPESDFPDRRTTISIIHDPVVDPEPVITPELESITDMKIFYNTVPLDIDSDGIYELLGLGSSSMIRPSMDLAIFAIEGDGILVDNYPIRTEIKVISSNKIVCDLNGDNLSEFIFQNERYQSDEIESAFHLPKITGIDLRGRCIPNFPIAADKGFQFRLAQLDDEPGLELVITSNSILNIIDIPNSNENSSIWWGQQYRDNDHSNAIWEPATPFSPTQASVLMPVDLCYNWPNPATSITQIRYFLNYTANVTVDIFDILGEKVTTFSRTGQAPGLPHEIPWVLNDIARGAYVAVVKAEGNGMSETKLVKIAVVK